MKLHNPHEKETYKYPQYNKKGPNPKRGGDKIRQHLYKVYLASAGRPDARWE